MAGVATNNGYLRQTTPDEQKLYDYFLYSVQTQTPEEILETFRLVFIEGKQVAIADVHEAFARLIKQDSADQDFQYILNRCCHIIINRWQIHPHLQVHIPQLINLLGDLPTLQGYNLSRHSRRVRQLVHHFANTDQYTTLKRLARVIEDDQQAKDTTPSETDEVGSLIRRYPYLYDYCLLSDDSSYEHQQTIRRLQHKIQRQFELDLSHYVAYQVRLAQVARRTKSLEQAKNNLTRIPNPTLLTDKELGTALKHFVGKVHGGYTHKDLSLQFLRQSIQAPSYGIFKEELFSYLISSVDSRYGNVKFNRKLYERIQQILPEYVDQKPSELLLIRTASQLLNFLTVESPHNREHYIFVDMITNLGPTATMVLLLKVLFVCHKVRPNLEKRFSILFNHYERASRDGVPWLIKSMENLHLALSVHFGEADVSCLNQIM